MAQPTVNPPPDLAALKREARRKGTPPERLLELAEMEPELARVIAGSSCTPLAVLAQLIAHEDTKTRRALAGNMATSSEILALLANDSARTVLVEVAHNPNTPEETQLELFELNISSVRRALTNKRPVLPKLQEKFVYSENQEDRLDIAQCHDLLPEFALLLSHDSDTQVREAIVFNHADKVKQEVLDTFVNSENPSLRGRVAEYSQNAHILKQLINDPEYAVAETAKQNPYSLFQGETP